MKIFIVLCEEGGYDPITTVEKVFLNESKAYKFATEQNCKFHYFRYWVEEREAEE